MLTKAEEKWVRRIQKALNECPSDRLGFYTIGDRDVFIYDKSKGVDESASESGRDFCQEVEHLDAGLGELLFPTEVHSTAG